MGSHLSTAARRPFRSRACMCVCLGLLRYAPTPAQTAPPPTAAAAQSTASPQTEREDGTVRGLVTDGRGVPIVGAIVAVQPAAVQPGAARAALLKQTSDGDGKFAVVGVPTGEFTVSVSYPGFDTAIQRGTVSSEQSVTLEPFALRLSTVSFTVNALTTEEVAAAELHTEETQRLLGFAPNFFVSYKWDAAPLTAGQKFGLAWKNVRDPGNLLLVGTVAGIQQATNGFKGYSQGAAGYGRRYGADLGNLVSGTFLGGAVYPSLFHQDPRYFYKGTGSMRSRVWYSLSSAVICRGDNGKRQFNWSGVLGDLSAGALSNAYYPGTDRHGAGLTLTNGFLGIAGDAMNGLVQEFFFKQITPREKKKTPRRP